MVEHAAVNRRVEGSSPSCPARVATTQRKCCGWFWSAFHQYINKSALVCGYTRIGIGAWFRPKCISIRSSTLLTRTIWVCISMGESLLCTQEVVRSNRIRSTISRLAQLAKASGSQPQVNGSNPLSGKLQVMLGEAAHSNNLIINPWYNIRLDLNNNITNSQMRSKVILYIYIIPTKRNNKVNQTK